MWLSVAVAISLYFADGAAADFTTVAGAFDGIGIIAGLVGTDLMLVQLVLAARVPIIDRTFGHDRALALHQKLGKPVLYLILAHMIMLLVGWGMADGLNPVAEGVSMITTLDDMLLAFITTGLLIALVVSSLVIVRRRLSYEAWYIVHLLAYATVIGAVFHQFSAGRLFAEGTLARWYWLGLYIITATALIVYRFAIPVIRSIRHRLQVASVTPIAAGVTSIELRGYHLAALPTSAGQFFVWRFWTPNMWWHAHPFSISAAPSDTKLRITVRDLGSGTKALSRLPLGTRVSIEGPYGLFTDEARTADQVVFIGAGIGIAPIRSLLETATFAPGHATVILRAPNAEHVYLWQEIYDLCVARGARLRVLQGSRPRGVDTWISADAYDAGESLESLAPDVTHSDVYICGPRKWTDIVVRESRAAGLPSHQIHFERFDW